ncbi:hypothetical protein KP509_35G065500 [Ceratopteris richardii]|uniref:Uncharacterized protein n=1 Tax=Ceratopteris richardii TaxID=49495 RepID=A0A8T2QH33_CERRI|nr:hypothetical protein KP509_35G065500 [Ceratopteris richardii]
MSMVMEACCEAVRCASSHKISNENVQNRNMSSVLLVSASRDPLRFNLSDSACAVPGISEYTRLRDPKSTCNLNHVGFSLTCYHSPNKIIYGDVFGNNPEPQTRRKRGVDLTKLSDVLFERLVPPRPPVGGHPSPPTSTPVETVFPMRSSLLGPEVYDRAMRPSSRHRSRTQPLAATSQQTRMVYSPSASQSAGQNSQSQQESHQRRTANVSMPMRPPPHPFSNQTVSFAPAAEAGFSQMFVYPHPMAPMQGIHGQPPPFPLFQPSYNTVPSSSHGVSPRRPAFMPLRTPTPNMWQYPAFFGQAIPDDAEQLPPSTDTMDPIRNQPLTQAAEYQPASYHPAASMPAWCNYQNEDTLAPGRAPLTFNPSSNQEALEEHGWPAGNVNYWAFDQSANPDVVGVQSPFGYYPTTGNALPDGHYHAAEQVTSTPMRFNYQHESLSAQSGVQSTFDQSIDQDFHWLARNSDNLAYSHDMNPDLEAVLHSQLHYYPAAGSAHQENLYQAADEIDGSADQPTDQMRLDSLDQFLNYQEMLQSPQLQLEGMEQGHWNQTPYNQQGE